MEDDGWLEMAYEDRFVSDIDEDDWDAIGPSMEVEPDECPYCYTPMGAGHTKDCRLNKPERSTFSILNEYFPWINPIDGSV
jgi:hypothetical protein